MINQNDVPEFRLVRRRHTHKATDIDARNKVGFRAAATPEIVQPALEASWQNISARLKSRRRHRAGKSKD